MTAYAQDERRALCDLLDEVGPDAPTLCAGWRTADLAAHLVVRDRRPDALPGVVFPVLRGWTDRVQRQTREGRTWSELVALVRSGPPYPIRLGPLDEAVNTAEFFIHHEDVRRAGGGPPEPRPLGRDVESSLWGRLRLMGRVLWLRAPVGVRLEAPGFGSASVRGGATTVTVTGPPSELLLAGFGRLPRAVVDLTGAEQDIEALRQARVGL